MLFDLVLVIARASLVAQMVKNLPAMGREDSLEKEMATHSSILAWEIPWTEKPGSLQSMGVKTKNIPHQKHAFQHLSQAKHLDKASGREIQGKAGENIPGKGAT